MWASNWAALMGTRWEIADALGMAAEYLGRAAKLLREEDTNEAKLLWEDGVKKLRRLEKISEARCRPIIGRWLKLVGGDAGAVLDMIARAESRDIGKGSIAWIEGWLKDKDAAAEIDDKAVLDTKIWKVQNGIRSATGKTITMADLRAMVDANQVTEEQAKQFGLDK